MTAPGRTTRFAKRCGGLVLLMWIAVHPLDGAEITRHSGRECAVCHIRWVEALARPGAQGDPMRDVIDRQAGSGDMCLSCHDGSVVDSRFKVWSTRHHTTDSVPSPAVHIPTDKFPLDEQGRMTCATCHTAHAVPDSSDLATVIFLRQPNVDSSLCLSCHREHAQKNDFQHPLGHADAPIPQAILAAGGKTSADGHTIICQTCHEPHGAANAWMLVLPPSQLCVACHRDKSPEISPPAGAPVHHIGRAYPGFEPPAALRDAKATFGPQGELTCLSCHRLHDASGARPLLIRANEDSSLCLECHKQEQAVLGSRHDLRQSAPQAVNARGETAAASGPCGACHRIHGWARDVPDTHRPHSSGCMECHDPGGPGARNRPYVEAHPVGIALPADKSIPLPLDEATRSIGCLTCHDPHTPRRPEAVGQKTGGPEGPQTPSAVDAGQAPRSFLRREGSQLCVICHDEIAASLQGPHEPTRFTPAERRALAIPPSLGACRVCHATHNAHGPHLWARTPPDSPDGPAANLCGTCHGKDAVKEPQETRHPLTIAHLGLATPASQDPNSPQSAGCAGCHDPHGGSDLTSLLRSPVASLCTSCHESKRGIKGSRHDPAVSDWARKLGFQSEGLCVDCHPIHGPRQEAGIWPSLGGASAPESLCEGCHRPGMPGPAVATPHVGKTFPHAPADPAGARMVHPDQQIRCNTCHDIHQSGQTPKLLRAAPGDSSLCLRCHADLGGILDTSHDLRKSAPTARNVRDETAAESGPCGACHLVHPAVRGGESWARPLPTAGGHGNGLCTGCHGPGGCAAGRVPERADHPDVPLLNRLPPGHPDYMPTFDEQGEPSRTGAISCPTCHQVHSPLVGSPGHEAGLPSPWMFLRMAHQRLCTDCHGAEAPWRFLFYHKATRNPRGRN